MCLAVAAGRSPSEFGVALSNSFVLADWDPANSFLLERRPVVSSRPLRVETSAEEFAELESHLTENGNAATIGLRVEQT